MADDKRKLTELCNLFSENAIIEANDGNTYSGREEINPFFEKFFNKNSELKHLWDTKEIADDLRRQIGRLYAAEKLESTLL